MSDHKYYRIFIIIKIFPSFINIFLLFVRCLYFSQGGECLFAGCHDVLKVYGWEPGRTLDSIPTGWGKVQDIAIAQNQLVRLL